MGDNPIESFFEMLFGSESETEQLPSWDPQQQALANALGQMYMGILTGQVDTQGPSYDAYNQMFGGGNVVNPMTGQPYGPQEAPPWNPSPLVPPNQWTDFIESERAGQEELGPTFHMTPPRPPGSTVTADDLDWMNPTSTTAQYTPTDRLTRGQMEG